MPNLAALLKAEITRLARKEVRANATKLHKATASHRSDIAALKRRVAQLEQQLKQAQRSPRASSNSASAPAPQAEADNVRFSAKSVLAQRKRLGLSAADLGLLFGTTGQSIYNWESGRSRPAGRHLAALGALRKLGRKQAAEIIASRRG